MVPRTNSPPLGETCKTESNTLKSLYTSANTIAAVTISDSYFKLLQKTLFLTQATRF